MFEFTPEGAVLTEIAGDTTVEQIQKCTTAKFKVSPDLKKMDSE